MSLFDDYLDFFYLINRAKQAHPKKAKQETVQIVQISKPKAI